ncbi:hypothetical protein FHP25_33645 [Vineibacter terrae]|uniref:EF-hand domain-containing protein n=1 Tax=Vineibacter terrae TaxID=2586908 RepID=A0A5C8PAM4_9HYPH|nr:hypothetical protein [Vineibacter terrae]TXL70598.1 hypothetical protein FHP25_33645 [Vineibacter terrae]
MSRSRTFIAALVAGIIGLGVAQAGAEDWRHQDGRYWDWRDRNHDGRIDRRDGPPRGYYPAERYHDRRSTTYRPEGSCRFQTRRGVITGYKPVGKDRCCIETRNGPSCQ